MSILDGLESVLFVHAHPDDETISTGALIAELVARDVRVTLLTASRGERGEVVPGPLSRLEGTVELTAHREQELQCATDALGIAEHYWLGTPPARAAGLLPRIYRDSGMRWIRPGVAGPSEDSGEDALTTAPLDEVTDDVAALIEQLKPSLVISYDDEGGYGHPDHVRVHEATIAASRAQGVPFAEILHAPVTDTEWFTFDAHLNTVTRALRCHASQLTVDGTHVVHSGGQRESIVTSVGLRVL